MKVCDQGGVAIGAGIRSRVLPSRQARSAHPRHRHGMQRAATRPICRTQLAVHQAGDTTSRRLARRVRASAPTARWWATGRWTDGSPPFLQPCAVDVQHRHEARAVRRTRAGWGIWANSWQGSARLTGVDVEGGCGCMLIRGRQSTSQMDELTQLHRRNSMNKYSCAQRIPATDLRTGRVPRFLSAPSKECSRSWVGTDLAL